MDSLVSVEWLAAHLGDVRVVDATLLDPALGRDARAEYRAGHIPGAAFLDLASLRNTADPLPNAFPPAERVAERLSSLGIAADDRLILYDTSPWRTAARAWFVLRHHGAGQVALLDGGLAAWTAAGLPLEAGEPLAAPAIFSTSAGPGWIHSLEEVRDGLGGAAQVIDARSAGRFAGIEPDPHGIPSGHIPGARNLPYTTLFEADGRWKRGEALARAFADAGIDIDRPITATCGSGVTAAVLLFGLHLLGRDGALYDGSWSEWGARADTPKVTA